MQPNLLVICVSAFAAVFVLLSFLAVVMRALVALFPAEVAAGTDAAMIAAVTSAVSVAYPGTKVTKIEEIQ
jgi:hypothetical protein